MITNKQYKEDMNALISIVSSIVRMSASERINDTFKALVDRIYAIPDDEPDILDGLDEEIKEYAKHRAAVLMSLKRAPGEERAVKDIPERTYPADPDIDEYDMQDPTSIPFDDPRSARYTEPDEYDQPPINTYGEDGYATPPHLVAKTPDYDETWAGKIPWTQYKAKGDPDIETDKKH